jgi:hypothetical protein
MNAAGACRGTCSRLSGRCEPVVPVVRHPFEHIPKDGTYENAHLDTRGTWMAERCAMTQWSECYLERGFWSRVEGPGTKQPATGGGEDGSAWCELVVKLVFSTGAYW